MYTKLLILIPVVRFKTSTISTQIQAEYLLAKLRGGYFLLKNLNHDELENKKSAEKFPKFLLFWELSLDLLTPKLFSTNCCTQTITSSVDNIRMIKAPHDPNASAKSLTRAAKAVK